MANFQDVFSTTGKVVVALLLIGLGVGVVLGIIGLISGQPSSPSPPSSAPSASSWDDDFADNASVRMPKSKWDSEVNAAIAAHCVFQGMSKDQAEQALGRPADTALPNWSYTRQDRSTCLRYSGDTCVEYITYEANVHFTAKGSVKGVDGAEMVLPKRVSSFCYAVAYPTPEKEEQSGGNRRGAISASGRSGQGTGAEALALPQPTQPTGEAGCPTLANGQLYLWPGGWQYCSNDGPCLTPKETKRCFK